MVNRGLVSICIPVYNGEEYLRECLDSVVAQTYRNFEVIICDDCSTDNSEMIIREYFDKLPSLRFFKNKKNLGLVGNWNRCIAESEGEWIRFIFQDDFMSPGCILRMLEASRGKALIASRKNYIFSPGTEVQKKNYFADGIKRTNDLLKSFGSWLSPEQVSRLAAKKIRTNFIGEPSLVMFRKDSMVGSELFSPDLIQLCDLEFFLRIATHHGFVYIDEDLSFFRVHEKSETFRNVKTKYFRIHFLEPVIYVLKLLTRPEFRVFRNHIGWLERKKLELFYKVKAKKAFETARQESDLLAMYLEEEKRFPQLSEGRKPGLMISLVSRFF